MHYWGERSLAKKGQICLNMWELVSLTTLVIIVGHSVHVGVYMWAINVYEVVTVSYNNNNNNNEGIYKAPLHKKGITALYNNTKNKNNKLEHVSLKTTFELR